MIKGSVIKKYCGITDKKFLLCKDQVGKLGISARIIALVVAYYEYAKRVSRTGFEKKVML